MNDGSFIYNFNIGCTTKMVKEILMQYRRKKKIYTKADLNRFDKLLTMTESLNNFTRICGRLDLKEWLKGFTKKTANEMFEKIKDK